jgi:glycosyltransferase involved in cell wall biosynthesis
MNISFIIPSKNNLNYLKNAYISIRKYYIDHEIVILDDCSTDTTVAWLNSLKDINLNIYLNTGKSKGHTILYNIGVKICKNEIFSIFHADMICGPYYVENLLKYLKEKTVVSATRIEPPLHPSGKEKIVKDFGMHHDDLKLKEFEEYCFNQQIINKNLITKGIFAPWCMYKKDFLSIGGHDETFAPFPYEDSDIFQRFILNGYNIIQSRDSFVYHLTCRGHRWTDQIQKDDEFYKQCVYKNSREYLRKWGSWIKNDEYSYPIIKNKYNVGFIIKNCNESLLSALEPWCSNIYVDCNYNNYIKSNQKITKFDLSSRVNHINSNKDNDVLIEFDGSLINSERFYFLTEQLSEILTDSAELGELEYDIFKISVKSLKTHQSDLTVTK